MYPVILQVFVSHQRRRNINLLSIGYAFRPRLRIRLTLGGFTFPRNPWAYGEGDSHSYYRYSCRHNHLYAVQRSLRYTFDPRTTLPYRCLAATRSFGNVLESRSFSAQKSSASKLLRTF